MDENLKRAQSLVGTSEGRPEFDYYPTPPEGTLALLSREEFQGNIWEPCCGEGWMSEVLRSKGFDVLSTDVIDYGYKFHDETVDFMTIPEDIVVDNIITNPPFALTVDGKKKGCDAFVAKALKHTTKKVAVLQKLAFLEGRARSEWFQTTPLKTVYVFGPRLTMFRGGEKMKNSGMIAFAWFVWEHGYEGKPEIEWICELPKNLS